MHEAKAGDKACNPEVGLRSYSYMLKCNIDQHSV